MTLWARKDKVLVLRIDEDTLKVLKKLAKTEANGNISAVVREAIYQFVNKHS
jgi:predicted transcriptional regulator